MRRALSAATCYSAPIKRGDENGTRMNAEGAWSRHVRLRVIRVFRDHGDNVILAAI